MQRNIVRVEEIHKTENLSEIKIGAHDEIFQGNKPILVGCDVKSTFIYLLSLENSRDRDTWAIRLLECKDKGLLLDRSVADGGLGLRAGQEEAFPGTPCHTDVFHALRDLTAEVTYQENKALSKLNDFYSLDLKMQKAKKQKKAYLFSSKLGKAKSSLNNRLQVADNISTIYKWLREDVLAVVGPNAETRRMLFDFLIEELEKLELLSGHIKKVRCKLQK